MPNNILKTRRRPYATGIAMGLGLALAASVLLGAGSAHIDKALDKGYQRNHRCRQHYRNPHDCHSIPATHRRRS